MAAVRLYRTVVLGPGFLAHLICSGTFVSGRDPQAVLTEDLRNYGPVSLFRWHVDRSDKTVTASLFGIGRRVAVFREGLGCTLAIGTTEAELRAQADGVFSNPPPLDLDALWPEGERVDLGTPPPGVDAAKLGAAIEAAFAEPSPKPKHLRQTRAIVVVHRGRIVAERTSPRASFAGHELTTPWDPLQRAYFNGYALWTYLNSPFLFALPGVTVTEIEPVDDHGQRWRGLQARFPATLASHSRVQEFYFDSDYLLCRHDYRVDIAGGFAAIQYIGGMVETDGIMLPATRRAYRCDADGKPLADELMVAIDLRDYRLT